MHYNELSEHEKSNILNASKDYIKAMQVNGFMKQNIYYKVIMAGSFINGNAKEFSDYDIFIEIKDEDATISEYNKYMKFVLHLYMQLYQKYNLQYHLDIRIRKKNKMLENKDFILLYESIQ